MRAKLVNPRDSSLKGREVEVIGQVPIGDKIHKCFIGKHIIWLTKTNGVENWHFDSNLEFIKE